MGLDFDSSLVRKPWGYEYLMYQNDQLGLWLLRLESGAATSLHCHPRKKTGLVILSGEAHLSFLNDGVDLKPLSRTIIRPGLFHSTKATSPDGLFLLEVETPRDKENLVRLEDNYGREAQPYEGAEFVEPLPSHLLQLGAPPAGEQIEYDVCGCSLVMRSITDPTALDAEDPQAVIMLLEGGLSTSDGEPILDSGDVVSPATFSRLVKSFPLSAPLTVLIINRQ